MRRKFISVLYGLLAFLAAEGVQIAVASILGILYVLIHGLNLGIEMDSNTLYLMSIGAAVVCGVAFAVWYYGALIEGTREEKKARFHHFTTRHNILWFLILGVGCQFFTSGIMAFIQSYFPKTFEQYSEVLELLTSGRLELVILFAIVIAPIVEEMIFRGVILHLIGRGNTQLITILMQAILFGIYHGNIVQGIYGAVLGALLGYIMVSYHTIAAPILLHMIINASSFLVNLFPNNHYSLLLMTLIGVAFLTGGIKQIKPV